MLDQCIPIADIDKESLKGRKQKVFSQLTQLQLECRALGVPVLVIVDGWDASGKGRVIGDLIDPLDPRGFRVVAQDEPSPEELGRPRLWKAWNHTPPRGGWSIWEQGPLSSWVLERCQDDLGRKEHERLCQELVQFEKLLTRDGTLIFKYFLHISRKEQRRRFESLEADKDTKGRVTPRHWRLHKHYDLLAKRYSQATALTNHPEAPWQVYEARFEQATSLGVLEDLAQRLDRLLAPKRATGVPATPPTPITLPPAPVPPSVDLSRTLSETAYHEVMEELQDRMRSLEWRIQKKGLPVVVAYEGWDAAGKGGNIKRLTEKLDPRIFTVVPIAAPTPEEKAHHYLWRFWRAIPRKGHITIFDRTWYGRVLVERIEGFCQEHEWKRAYEEIVSMERQWIRSGMILVKFWLEIDSATQLKRFEDRQNTPEKRHKITEEDWRNREKAPAYRAAVDEMLARTSTVDCPWTVIESNDKYWARVKALRTVIQALEDVL